MNDIDLGTLIKELKKKAGFTQLELPNLTRVGKTIIFDIEKKLYNLMVCKQ